MTRPLAFTPTHLTYRLRHSVPRARLAELNRELDRARHRLERDFPADRRAEDPRLRDRYVAELYVLHREHYVAYDRLLDRVETGPVLLAGTAEKQIILASWAYLATAHNLHLYAISVMSNHVHVLTGTRQRGVTVDLERLLRNHRVFTANALNRLHGTPGRRVWAQGVYDRTVRPGCFGQVLWYVLNNPVKAGLTDRPLEWVGNRYAEVVYETFIESRGVGTSGGRG